MQWVGGWGRAQHRYTNVPQTEITSALNASHTNQVTISAAALMKARKENTALECLIPN